MSTLSKSDTPIYVIEWQPIGLKSTGIQQQTILAAAQSAGIRFVAFCGGNGTCGSCKIRIIKGELSPITETERSHLSDEDFAHGMRLACQIHPLSDLKIEIPPSTLSTEQRLQLEGEGFLSIFSQKTCPIQSVHLQIKEPSILDSCADTVRIKKALLITGNNISCIHPCLLHSISDVLRELHWDIQLILRNQEVIAVLPKNAIPLGLAVDIGTTKIAAYLIDLKTGFIVLKKGEMNPQISYGEDIISRIAYTNINPEGREALQKNLVHTINKLICDLCKGIHVVPNQIVETVFVGNTAIHHFFCNLPVGQLGRYPFVAAVSEALNFSASDFGLKISPAAGVYLPPNIAGYVGADHIAMLIGTNSDQCNRTRIAIDIGTNTEISLIHQGKIFSCSCASGPAFEGAHISCGMRAADGAIERVQISDGVLQIKTISDQPPIGFCGSGILDMVAALRKSGIINARGNFNKEDPRVQKAERNYEFVVVSKEKSTTGKAITVTRADINEIILAKSAIRTGIEILLETTGITSDQIEEFIVAGAFGTFLNVNSAVIVGMFPDINPEKFQQVGNAAGTGACAMLRSTEIRKRCEELSQRITYVELSTYPNFNDILISWMHL